MSGGSYDYAYSKVADMAASIRADDPLHRAFKKHLKLVAKAMHDVEWVDSGDYGKGDDVEAIRAVLAPGAELVTAIQMAEEARDMLDTAIRVAEERAVKT